jgi:vitamin B12 transporter
MPTRYFSRPLLFYALSLGTSTLLFAAAATSPATAQIRTIDIPTVVISADQIPLNSDRVGASVTVLSGPALREKNLQTLGDALRSVPGVEVDSSGGRGSLTVVRIRGGEARHTMVLIDGIEVNQLGFPGFNFADLTLDDVERVEVLRGPQSGIYGANAQAGVISIVTLSGRGLKRPTAMAKIEGGSMATASGSAAVRGAAGPFYGAVSVSAYGTGGYNVSRAGSERDGSRAFTGTGKFGFDVTPDINIEGVVRHTDRDVDIDRQNFATGLLTDSNSKNQYRSTAARIGATFTLFSGHWVQSVNAKLFDEQSRASTNGVTTFGADGQRTNLDSKSVFSFASNVFGGEKHTAVVLFDRRNERYRQISGVSPFDKVRNSLAGEYILDLPTNTTLSGALRKDWNSAFADVTTWRGAISQRFPAIMSRLHASAGKGVTDPDVFQLFGSSFNLPNPGLQPESSVGWDTGVEQTWFGGRVVTDVTYFSTNFTDKIELIVTRTAPGFIYRNGTGAAVRRGFEVSQVVQWLDWLSTTLTYTYTHALDSTELQEVRRPPHAAAFEVTAFSPDRRTRGTVRLAYNGIREDLFFGPGGPPRVDLPAYALVRATVSHDLTPWATFYVRGENIFNKRYEDVLSFRAPGAAVFAGLKLRTPD